LLAILEAYELPAIIKERLFAYHEQNGAYDKAENILFELLEDMPGNQELRAQGLAFYTRLLQQSDADLAAGNLPRAEIEEGLAQLHPPEP
ncbi:MAG: hypothetical protein J2P37_33660, partial [Ktedonobacteraceae bacterium]|nr:hypothetical protein [Ktedonobacteraceae bacterium]